MILVQHIHLIVHAGGQDVLQEFEQFFDETVSSSYEIWNSQNFCQELTASLGCKPKTSCFVACSQVKFSGLTNSKSCVKSAFLKASVM